MQTALIAKLGERLLDLACSAASWAICFTPSPTARRRARPVSMIVAGQANEQIAELVRSEQGPPEK